MENKLGDYLTKVNEYIQFRIDTTRILIDKPSFNYQPLPWIGIHEAKVRGEATYERWDAISEYLKDSKSLKDIGCCVGFFCHKAAENYGMNTIGLDMNNRYLRIAKYTSKHVENGEKELFLNLKIDIDTVKILPTTDSTILFSVWHHWVFYYGLNIATVILKEVWSKTNKVLLFESGEEETKEEFNLPFDKKATEWLNEYLLRVLPNAKVKEIGTFSVGNYAHYKLKGHKRTVFAITKV